MVVVYRKSSSKPPPSVGLLLEGWGLDIEGAHLIERTALPHYCFVDLWPVSRKSR